jgi:hypothetical protein
VLEPVPFHSQWLGNTRAAAVLSLTTSRGSARLPRAPKLVIGLLCVSRSAGVLSSDADGSQAYGMLDDAMPIRRLRPSLLPSSLMAVGPQCAVNCGARYCRRISLNSFPLMSVLSSTSACTVLRRTTRLSASRSTGSATRFVPTVRGTNCRAPATGASGSDRSGHEHGQQQQCTRDGDTGRSRSCRPESVTSDELL